MYRIINRQTGEVIIGSWDEVADHDVRIWTRPVLIDNEPETPEPLCYVHAWDAHTEEFVRIDIMSLADLDDLMLNEHGNIYLT